MRTIWAVVRFMLEKVTRNKISFHSDGGAQELLKLIPENQLEEQYGGCQERKTSNFHPPSF